MTDQPKGKVTWAIEFDVTSTPDDIKKLLDEQMLMLKTNFTFHLRGNVLNPQWVKHPPELKD